MVPYLDFTGTAGIALCSMSAASAAIRCNSLRCSNRIPERWPCTFRRCRPFWPNSGPDLAESAQLRPNPTRARQNMGQRRSNLAEFGPTPPSLGQLRPTSANFTLTWTSLGRFQPNADRFRLMSTRNRTTLGPNSTSFGSSSTSMSPSSINVGPHLTKFDQHMPR